MAWNAPAGRTQPTLGYRKNLWNYSYTTQEEETPVACPTYTQVTHPNPPPHFPQAYRLPPGPAVARGQANRAGLDLKGQLQVGQVGSGSLARRLRLRVLHHRPQEDHLLPTYHYTTGTTYPVPDSRLLLLRLKKKKRTTVTGELNYRTHGLLTHHPATTTT